MMTQRMKKLMTQIMKHVLIQTMTDNKQMTQIIDTDNKTVDTK